MNPIDIKYQIFLSSTFIDLKKERALVQETILGLYHLPIGMETFHADNDEQWEIIKETIDTSDLYIIIIGHRYGSLTKKGKRIISLTQKEYEYASEKKKKIPTLIFIRERNAEIDMSLTDPENGHKLAEFIHTLERSGKNVDYWTNADDLGRKISLALNKTINKFNSKPEILRGWVKRKLENSHNFSFEDSLLLKNKKLIYDYLESSCSNCVVENIDEITHTFDADCNCVIERIRIQKCKTEVQHTLIEYRSDKDGYSEVLEITDITPNRPTKKLPYVVSNQGGTLFKFFILYEQVIPNGHSFKYKVKVRIENFLSNLIDNGIGFIEFSILPNATSTRKDILIFPNIPKFDNLSVKLTKGDKGQITNTDFFANTTPGKKIFSIDYGTINADCEINLEFKLN